MIRSFCAREESSVRPFYCTQPDLLVFLLCFPDLLCLYSIVPRRAGGDGCGGDGIGPLVRATLTSMRHPEYETLSLLH